MSEFFSFKSDKPLERTKELAAAVNQLHNQMRKVAVLPRLGKPLTGDKAVVITIRIPKSLHAQLRNQAHTMKTSMNKLCVARLASTAEVSVEPANPEDPDS